MRYFTVALLVITLFLQYRLWLGDGNLLEWREQQLKIDELKSVIEEKQERNRSLRADVDDLNSGLAAIEEHARRDLGLVAPEETFFQLVDESARKNTSGK